MARIGETARVTAPGANLQDAVGLVYTRMRALAAKGTPRDDGHLVNVSLKRLVESLYPHILLLSEVEQKGFISRIQTGLRQSGNARVDVIGGPGRASTWWVRDYYTTPDVICIGGRRGSADKEPTHTERRLTAHEAGEDRTPSPVTVTKTGEPMMTITEPVAHLRQRVLDLLAANAQPLTEDEVRFALGLETTSSDKATGRPKKNGSLSHVIRTLVNARDIFSRIETIEERRLRSGIDAPAVPNGRGARLYSLKRKVPARTERVAIADYEFSPGVQSREGHQAYVARARDKRNSKVLNALIEVGRPMTPDRIGALVGMAPSTVGDACKDLLEAKLVHTTIIDRSRVWAEIDVPLQPTPAKEDTVTLPHGMNATEYHVFSEAQRVAQFTYEQLAQITGRSESTISKVVTTYKDLFERTGTDGNRRSVFRVIGASTPAPQPVAASPAPLAAASVTEDVKTQIASLLGLQGDSGELERLREENAQLRAALAKAKAALAVYLEQV